MSSVWCHRYLLRTNSELDCCLWLHERTCICIPVELMATDLLKDSAKWCESCALSHLWECSMLGIELPTYSSSSTSGYTPLHLFLLSLYSSIYSSPLTLLAFWKPFSLLCCKLSFARPEWSSRTLLLLEIWKKLSILWKRSSNSQNKTSDLQLNFPANVFSERYSEWRCHFWHVSMH